MLSESSFRPAAGGRQLSGRGEGDRSSKHAGQADRRLVWSGPRSCWELLQAWLSAGRGTGESRVPSRY